MAVRNPAQSAITVPKATPLKPIPQLNTRNRLSGMLTALTPIDTIIGLTVFCIPSIHPSTAMVPNNAGAAHISVLK